MPIHRCQHAERVARTLAILIAVGWSKETSISWYARPIRCHSELFITRLDRSIGLYLTSCFSDQPAHLERSSLVAVLSGRRVSNFLYLRNAYDVGGMFPQTYHKRRYFMVTNCDPIVTDWRTTETVL